MSSRNGPHPVTGVGAPGVPGEISSTRWTERGFTSYPAACRAYRSILERLLRNGVSAHTSLSAHLGGLEQAELLWLIAPWWPLAPKTLWCFTFAPNGRQHEKLASNYSFALVDLSIVPALTATAQASPAGGQLHLFSITQALRGKNPFYGVLTT